MWTTLYNYLRKKEISLSLLYGLCMNTILHFHVKLISLDFI